MYLHAGNKVILRIVYDKNKMFNSFIYSSLIVALNNEAICGISGFSFTLNYLLCRSVHQKQ